MPSTLTSYAPTTRQRRTLYSGQSLGFTPTPVGTPFSACRQCLAEQVVIARTGAPKLAQCDRCRNAKPRTLPKRDADPTRVVPPECNAFTFRQSSDAPTYVTTRLPRAALYSQSPTTRRPRY